MTGTTLGEHVKLTLTLDDREAELGFAEPPNTEDVDRKHGDAHDGGVACLVAGVGVPEREEDGRGGDFDGDGDRVRVEVIPSAENVNLTVVR